MLPGAKGVTELIDIRNISKLVDVTLSGETRRPGAWPAGGRGLIVERRAGGDAHHRLRFEAIDRPRRLVFLFSADPAEEGEWTRVAIDIAPTPMGCTLTLTHEMDPAWASYEEQTRKGWTMILESLGRITETENG